MNTLRCLVLGSLLGFSMSLVSCGTVGKCTPSNCAFGCCDSSGTCQGGVSDSQCGGQGNSCMACGIGRQCQIGQCVPIGTGLGGGTGGGTSGGGTGGGTTGGGTGGGTTGGGTTGGGTTGGGTTGGGTTGGGTGGGTTGGGTGGGTTGGGGGGTNATCTSLGASIATFSAGRTSCGSLTLDPNFAARCTSAISMCSTSDQSVLTTFGTCVASVPCTTGNETAAQNQFFTCLSATETLSTACRDAVFSSSGTGGGGGTTGGGGGTTGGGGGTTGGGGGTTGGGGGTTGGGGGTTGGGGGTTGGGTGCTPLSLSAQRSAGRYLSGTSLEYTFASGFSAANDPTDIVGMEVIWAADFGAGLMDLATTVPATNVNLATGGTYFECTYCATLRRGCTFNTTSMAFDCTGGSYLARLGSLSVSAAPRVASGTFSGSLSNVTFEEWNLQNDTPVTGGRCFTLPSFSLTNVTVQ